MSTDNTDDVLEPEGTTPEGQDGSEITNPQDNAGEEAESPVAADPLSEAMDTISSLEDKLARANADYYNLQQEYNAYVRRSKQEAVAVRAEGQASVIEALLPVLDDVDLARQHGDLSGPTGLIAEKIEATLATNYQVERFAAVGDEFDPTIHEALMHQTSPDAEGETISAVIQPGYRQGEKLLRPARVGVISPE